MYHHPNYGSNNNLVDAYQYSHTTQMPTQMTTQMPTQVMHSHSQMHVQPQYEYYQVNPQTNQPVQATHIYHQYPHHQQQQQHQAIVANGSFTYLNHQAYYSTSGSQIQCMEPQIHIEGQIEPVQVDAHAQHIEQHIQYEPQPCVVESHSHAHLNAHYIDAAHYIQIQQQVSNPILPPPPPAASQAAIQADIEIQQPYSLSSDALSQPQQVYTLSSEPSANSDPSNIVVPSLIFHIDCTTQPPVIHQEQPSQYANTSSGLSLNNLNGCYYANSTSGPAINIPIEFTIPVSNSTTNLPSVGEQTEIYTDEVSKCRFSQALSSRSTFTDVENSEIQAIEKEYVPDYYHIPAFDMKTFDYMLQSLEAENGERINTINANGRLVTFLEDHLRTVYDLFLHGWRVSNNGRYLGWRSTPEEPYKWIGYKDADDLIKAIGSAFIEVGLEPRKNEKIGIFARNRPEWTLIDVACAAYSFVSVPIFDTIGHLGVDVILNQTKMRLVICDDPEKALKLMKHVSDLRVIVILENVISHEASLKANERNIKLIKFKKFKRVGQKNIRQPIPPNSNDIYTICYTSGTTAMPKGVILTHGNILAVISSLLIMFRDVGLAYGKETHFSYLPMAHMFERIAQALMLGLGGSIGFYQGDSRRIQDDVIQLKPTVFCSVPRLLTKFYVEITQSIANSPIEKQQHFETCFAQKERDIESGIINHRSPADQAFKEIREIFGGRLKLFFIGSAPISKEIVKFFKIVCGCHVMEGYGTTETSGVASLQFPGDPRHGNAGPPLPCSIFKLEDVPELNLSVKRDKKGEIMVYGPNIFKGYYKDEERTREMLDSNGWYRTGDVGMFDETGCIQVVDRIKHMFRLQSGEYVAPGMLENIYLRSDLISQIFVYGDALKNNLVAVVVPKEAIFLAMAKKNNMEVDFKSMCLNPSIRQAILTDLSRIATETLLNPHERIKDVYLHPEMFTVDNNLLTATMKLKRNEIKNYFRKEIDNMYRRIE